MKTFFTIFTLVLVVSCAPIYVNHDYETGTDFSKYKTYNILPELQSDMSELDEKRFLDAVDVVLQQKGYTVSDTPDLYVSVSNKEFQGQARNTVGVGVGGGGRNIGGGVSVGIPVGQSNINRELILDLIDVKNNSLIWQAVSESSFNPKASPEKRKEQLMAITAKMFAEFPPEKK